MPLGVQDLGASHAGLDLRDVGRRLGAGNDRQPVRLEAQAHGRARRVVLDHLDPTLGDRGLDHVVVPGEYVGEARDLDGYPSYLWLAEGEHRVAVHKGGFLVFDERSTCSAA